jgi:hypothetical protein
MQSGNDNSEKIKQLTKLLKERNSPIPLDEIERNLANIEKFLQRTSGPTVTTQTFLEEAAATISRMFEFTELAVAIKDRSDGKYRYGVFVGMRGEAIAAYRKLAYTFDEMFSVTKFPRIKLDNYIDFFLGEYVPDREGEMETFNRPSQLTKEREAVDVFREGDYLCAYIRGAGSEVIGWFEIGRTMSGKLPSRQTFKWLELIVSIVGKILYERDFAANRR